MIQVELTFDKPGLLADRFGKKGKLATSKRFREPYDPSCSSAATVERMGLHCQKVAAEEMRWPGCSWMNAAIFRGPDHQ
jgi:hypothetical protein